MSNPMHTTHPFIVALDETINRYGLLKHPFYQRWTAGELSRWSLAEYAKQYYAHVKAFPTYVSAVHSRCNDLAVRQMLLENLIEEEQGDDNHPELWLRFGERLGLSREAVKAAGLLTATVDSVATMQRLTRSPDYREGIAALYAYESQVPEVAATKREGLKMFYNIEDARSTAYFRVHEEADVIHRQVEREVLVRHATDEATQDRVLKAADEAARAQWLFLDGVYNAYVDQEVTRAEA